MPRKRKMNTETSEWNNVSSVNVRSSLRLAAKNRSSYFESNEKHQSTSPPKRVKKSVVKKSKQFSNKRGKEDVSNVVSMIEESESKYFVEVNKPKATTSADYNDTGYGDSNSSSEEWEEVADASDISCDELADYKPQLPTEGIQITVNVPTKKQKKKLSVDDLVRQQINKRLKEKQENLHKTHLLCYIARGLYMNGVLANDSIKAISLSYHSDAAFQFKEMNLKILKKLLEWFTHHFKLIDCKVSNEESSLNDIIFNAIQCRQSTSEAVFILMFISLLRTIESLPVDIRLCYAVNPLPIKPRNLIPTDRQREQKKLKEKNSNKDAINDNEKTTLISSDDNDDIIILKNSQSSHSTKTCYRNFWVEVYLSSDKKWVCVDPITKTIDDVSKISEETYDPLLYVFAFDNENSVKDVTQRYYLKWTDSKFRSNRADEKWLRESLNPFKSPLTDREDEENSQLTQFASCQQLPSTLSAFKNHPLYVLERHLLKYEVIYPRNAPKVGSFRGDNIYSREFVHTVHSDIYWRRQGRVVTVGEAAYKVSKARPKWDKISHKFIRDLPLELFGYWQTEPFVPPVAKDGKVPRNEFGNVELFQRSMLPKGTVHIPLPGLLRIANKLGIDCVPAVVGFDCHSGGGGTHPVYDGFVVCEEFKEVLLAAYDEEEENSRKRLQERKTNRVLGNWKRLIKAAIIREKLRNKYSNDV